MKETVKHTARKGSRRVIVPSSLAKGDTIGLVAPAGPIINKENFSAGISFLEKQGFTVKYDRNLLHAKGYLAGSDQERADDFNRLWADPAVKGLVAARGGYGSMRMVDLIDMQQIRRNPKILIGFSDLTVLLSAIHKKTGLVTYHGPVVTTLGSIDRQSQTRFLNVLAGKTTDLLQAARVRILKKGRARGVLLGGNLTTLVHMIGTPYELPWHDAILFIEDIGESPYRLDRLLTHLDKAGRLQKISGIILGTFCDENRREKKEMQRAVQERILELLGKHNIPVWADFPAGHSRRNLTLPIGAEVEMDSRGNMLKFL